MLHFEGFPSKVDQKIENLAVFWVIKSVPRREYTLVHVCSGFYLGARTSNWSSLILIFTQYLGRVRISGLSRESQALGWHDWRCYQTQGSSDSQFEILASWSARKPSPSGEDGIESDAVGWKIAGEARPQAHSRLNTLFIISWRILRASNICLGQLGLRKACGALGFKQHLCRSYWNGKYPGYCGT